MSEPEALKYIRNFLFTPSGNIEIEIKEAESIMLILSNHRQEVEGVKGLNYYLTGGLVNRLKTEQFWRNLSGVQGWWEWGDFVKEKLDMSSKKADALERVWKRATRFSMPPEAIEEVGWSTADTILRFSNSKEEVVELTEKCKSSPTKTAFVANLRDERGDAAHGRAVFQKHLRFTKEEAAAYDNALQEFARSAKKELYINMRAEEAILSVLVLWKTAVDEAKMLSGGR